MRTKSESEAGEAAAPVPTFVKAVEKEGWRPIALLLLRFDWIQLKSDEWLNGEFIALYKDNLEFDSDALDLSSLKRTDVTQVHTVRIVGNEVSELKRSQVLSITSGAPTELQKWSGKARLGRTVRQVNVNQLDINTRANFKRRTVEDRIKLDSLKYMI